MKEDFPKPVQPHEDLFKKADAVCDAMGGRIRKSSYKLRALINTNLEEWSRILFEAARSARGTKKVQYAATLRIIESYTDSEKYHDMLSKLMTNVSAIDQLMEEGGKEGLPWNELKRWWDRKRSSKK